MVSVISYKGLDGSDRPMGPAPLSPALLAEPFLFLSGQVPIDPETREVVGTTVAEQTRQVLRNIQNLVENAGFAMSDVVKVGIFLTRLDEFAAMNAVYAEFFQAPYPVRATVGVTLNDPRLLVEMDAIALRRS
jgi:2-iminobutanoate/2-iminopropanoate deaminase